jgi:hypothetical protein
MAGLVVLAAAGGNGCYRPYVLPTENEPHALVKVRVVYHASPGPQLSQLVLINNERIELPSPPRLPGEITRAVPVRPMATRWDVRTEFFHTVSVPQIQTYTTTSSYPCGRSTCTRSQTHTRTVYVHHRIIDAACAQAAGQGPVVGGIYLLNYDFYASGHCTLMCMRQWQQPDGSFRQTPCEPAPPAPPPS